jgi:transposase-like protein
MTHTTLPDEIWKTDALGRVRTPKARREALLAEFERSGVSGKKFAALVGVNYQTFASWVQQQRKQRGESPSAAKGGEVLCLVEAVVEAGGGGGGGRR